MRLSWSMPLASRLKRRSTSCRSSTKPSSVTWGTQGGTAASITRPAKDEDELRRLWSKPDTRKALLQGLAEKGFGGEQLSEISRMINAEKSDVFDVLAYIAFALAPITPTERIEMHRSEIFTRYNGKLQAFLEFVLAQ